MMLVSAIYLMLPQRSAFPLLFQYSKHSSQLDVLEKHIRPVAAIDLLTEAFIEEYILMRHAITADYDELMTRWGRGSRLFWMSSRKVYQDFVSNDINNNIWYSSIFDRLIHTIQTDISSIHFRWLKW